MLLNTTIQIYRKDNIGSDFHPVYDWNLVSLPEATINMLSERNIIRNEGNTILADHEIFIEYTDIKFDDRIKHGSSVYRVYSVYDPNGMNDHVEVKCLLLAPGIVDEMGLS